MKWGVVIAGASDFFRPAEKLSITQNLALMATGSIWTRWCFVIRPKNMLYVLIELFSSSLLLKKVKLTISNSLAAVNFCLFLVGTTQCSRILFYNIEQEGSTGAAFSKIWGEIKGSSKKTEKDVKAGAEEVKEIAA
jgi:mitochondrial pyruvate carrier 2